MFFLRDVRERSQSAVYIRGERFTQGDRNQDNFCRSIPRRTVQNHQFNSRRELFRDGIILQPVRAASAGDVFSFRYKHVEFQCINKARARVPAPFRLRSETLLRFIADIMPGAHIFAIHFPLQRETRSRGGHRCTHTAGRGVCIAGCTAESCYSAGFTRKWIANRDKTVD